MLKKMNRPINLFGVYVDESAAKLVLEVLASGQIASGAYVEKFALGLRVVAHQPNVVTVNDMSTAIQIALRLAGVNAGDDVLTTSFACMSTNAPIATAGANPVWVDVDPQTGLMDPVALERSITARSRAVLVYHLAGYPAPISQISKICKANGLKLIEDCDNALLSTLCDSPLGTFGDYAIYSFYPNRQINALEGGALSCRDPKDAALSLIHI